MARLESHDSGEHETEAVEPDAKPCLGQTEPGGIFDRLDSRPATQRSSSKAGQFGQLDTDVRYRYGLGPGGSRRSILDVFGGDD